MRGERPWPSGPGPARRAVPRGSAKAEGRSTLFLCDAEARSTIHSMGLPRETRPDRTQRVAARHERKAKRMPPASPAASPSPCPCMARCRALHPVSAHSRGVCSFNDGSCLCVAEAGWAGLRRGATSAAAHLPSEPPLDRRLARTGRCPGLRASPPSLPGPWLSPRLRPPGGPRTAALAARSSCVEAAPKADVQPRGTCRRKDRSCVHITPLVSGTRTTRQPRAFPPYPPRTHPKQTS